MNRQLTSNAAALLTAGSIFKFWIIEFFMCEVLIGLFVVFKASSKKFTIAIGGESVASSAEKLPDFIVLSLFACLLTAFLSVLLWVGQKLLSRIVPLRFQLRQASLS